MVTALCIVAFIVVARVLNIINVSLVLVVKGGGTQLPMCPRNGSQTLSQDIPSPRSWQRICQINLLDLAMVVKLWSWGIVLRLTEVGKCI